MPVLVSHLHAIEVHATIAAARERRRGDRRHRLREHLGVAGEAPQRGPGQELEADARGNRIARKTEKEFVPRGSHLVSSRQTTENERATGFDRYFPELEISSKFCEGLFHKIHFTHRNTTGSNHDIALFESAGQCEPEWTTRRPT